MEHCSQDDFGSSNPNTQKICGVFDQCATPAINSAWANGRYIGFLKSLQESLKPQMTMLINYCVSNQNSNTGKNVDYLLTLYQKDSVSSLIDSKFDIKRTRVNPLLENEDWKINLIEELSLIKAGFLTADLEQEVLEEMLETLTTE